jgi:predicted nucleotidyltransferase component of viral defense system
MIENWLELSQKLKNDILRELTTKVPMPEVAIEKDWWVTQTLRLIFSMDCAPHLVFKGGTSLSKAWSLIDRFSEDIDLALDRSYLGFGAEMTPSKVKKLRRASFVYISESFFPQLVSTFAQAGIEGLNIQLGEIRDPDQDPLIIEIYYPSIAQTNRYVQPRVLVEIGSRSLREPFTLRSICSIIGENFKGQSFADKPIDIPTVNPERTFLEKIFLLHEEFQKPVEKIRVDRLSRHLYDIEKLMDTEYGKIALEDRQLYQTLVNHRKTIIPIRGINYTNHTPDKINPLPPDQLLTAWKKDYEIMQESMIYGTSLPFEQLIERIKELKNRFNLLKPVD